MTTYAVLLECYEPIPHIEVGQQIADLIGVHPQDAFMHLRRQQGIIWEGLEESDAKRLGGFLIGKGYPAGLVPDEFVVKLGKPKNIGNADPVEGGFEMEDFYGKKTLIEAGRIDLAQAGWVDQKLDVTQRPTGKMVQSKYGPVEGQWRMTRTFTPQTPEYVAVGWVLHLFLNGEPVEWYRLVGADFVYDYQKIPVVERKRRFGILLNDLAKVLDFDILDPVYKTCMGSASKPESESKYDTLAEMTERARWILTMKRLES